MHGVMDEVRVYNYVRTPAQMAWEYDKGKPAAWYKFDEGTGSTVNNSGNLGIEYSGTLGTGSSAPTWATDGKRNSALSFDGGDYLQVTDASTLRFDAATNDFSLFAWIKRGAIGAIHHIISKEDDINDGWRLMVNADNTVTCSVDSIDITSTATIDTAWHNVGCTIDRDGNGQVYIDGRPSGAATAISSEVMANTSNLLIGTRSYTSSGYFNGYIDEPRIYNYVLTADQIKLHMNDGAAAFR